MFYREAGPKNAPVVLLLHGFPSSSRMFRNLIPLLSDTYRVIAPDYPGFGHSGVPDPASFSYTFDGLADIVDHLLDQLDVDRFTLYMMDFGAPVGFRLALKHPERVSAIVMQNAPLYPKLRRDGGRRSGSTGTLAPPSTGTPHAPTSARRRREHSTYSA